MPYLSRIIVCLAAFTLVTATSQGQVADSKTPNTLGEELRPLERSKQGDGFVVVDIQK